MFSLLNQKSCLSRLFVYARCKLNSSVTKIMVGLCLLSLQCCSPLLVQAPSPPFAKQQILDILSCLEEQEASVRSFFSSGRLVFNQNGSESDANILIAGTRDPLCIKVEITHPWGQPLIHILINETKLYIVSYHEKRYYFGLLEDLCSLRVFPAPLEPDQAWSLVRGYPVLRKYDRAVSSKKNQITLLSGTEEAVQVIDFYPESNLPRLVSFPGRDTMLSFSDFQNECKICYARDIRLIDPETGEMLLLELKQMVFNKSIPEAILRLEIPPDFEVLPLR